MSSLLLQTMVRLQNAGERTSALLAGGVPLARLACGPTRVEATTTIRIVAGVTCKMTLLTNTAPLSVHMSESARSASSAASSRHVGSPARSPQNTAALPPPRPTRLHQDKLHVTFAEATYPEGPIIPRRYTLTHSDRTGELFLTIGPDYDHRQVSGWYTRLMRDEVLAEWQDDKAGPALHVHCHVSGGLALGPAGWRFAIFRREIPLVLEALRYGDARLFESHGELDGAPIWVHLHAVQERYDVVEEWGVPAAWAGAPL
jgi:hypothetical protein